MKKPMQIIFAKACLKLLLRKMNLVWLACFFTSSSFALEPQKLTVMLDQTLNTTHAPLIIAINQGFFKEQGLEVELVNPNKLSDPSQLIAANKADVGLTYEPWFIEHVDQGLPIVRVGTLIDKPLNCIVALQKSGIKSLSDLKGKEIGSANNPVTNVILTNMLAKQGVSDKDIKLIKLRQNLDEALLTHKVAAISGTMRNLDVPMLENTGHKLVVFFPEEHGVPNYSELVFITNTSHAKDARFPRFLTAVKKAVRYLDEHPQEAWLAFTKQYPALNTALNREYWFATIPYFAENPAELNREEYKHFADFMRQNKLISKTLPVSRYAITVG